MTHDTVKGIKTMTKLARVAQIENCKESIARCNTGITKLEKRKLDATKLLNKLLDLPVPK